jgi:hypothetical protein
MFNDKLPNGNRSRAYWLRGLFKVLGVVLLLTGIFVDWIPDARQRLILITSLLAVEIVIGIVLRRTQNHEFLEFLSGHLRHSGEPDLYEVNDTLAVIGAYSKMTAAAHRLVGQLTLNLISEEEFKRSISEMARSGRV